MSFCAKCGAEIGPDSPFCGSCGAPAPGAEAAPAQAAVPTPPAAAAPPPPPPGMATPPPPMAGAPAYGPPMAPAGPAYQPPKSGGGGAKVAIFALIGLLVVGAIVVLILGFAGPKWFVSDDNGGGGGSSAPEKVVDTFLKAMEQKDTKMLLSTFSPTSMGDLEDQIGDYYTDLEELFDEMMFSTYESMKFSNVKYKTSISGDTATVEIVSGTVTIVDEYGDKTTEDVDDSDTPAELELIKENGKWYIDYDSM